jgi:hypothetical protein
MRVVVVPSRCGSGAFILSSPVCTLSVIVGNPAASALRPGFGCVCCRPLSADSCRLGPFGSTLLPRLSVCLTALGAPSRPSTGIASRGGARLRTVSAPWNLPAAETPGVETYAETSGCAHSPERLQPAGAAHAAGHSNLKGR